MHNHFNFYRQNHGHRYMSEQERIRARNQEIMFKIIAYGFIALCFWKWIVSLFS